MASYAFWWSIAGILSLPVVAQAQARPIEPLVGHARTLKARRGDTLPKIARRENVNLDSLIRLNKMAHKRLRPGQMLVLPTLHILPRNPKDGIVLNIAERRVYIFKKGALVAHYPVAVGKADWQTEAGTFRLRSKKVNPSWIPTKEMQERETIKDEKVPPGPDNPLGDRWMGWSKPGFGFHSTIAPQTIGLAVTHGCVRLYPDAARRMFDQVEKRMSIFSIYEPVLIGKRNGLLYLSVFPDIYHRNLTTVARVLALLKKEGIPGRIDVNKIKRIVKRQEGYPFPIARESSGPISQREPIAATPEPQAQRQIAVRLMKRVKQGRLTFVVPERDQAQLAALSHAPSKTADDHPALSLNLLRVLDRLSARATPQKPFVLLSLARPHTADRPEEPHGNGLAVDIRAYGGHAIDNRKPAECVAGVLAVIAALGPGHYRLGLPKPPKTDPIALATPPKRPAGWPFFPAPLPRTVDLCACGAEIVLPRVQNGSVVHNRQGDVAPDVARWENEKSAPLSEVRDARVRAAIRVAAKRKVAIPVLFPDAQDHLHLDVRGDHQ